MANQILTNPDQFDEWLGEEFDTTEELDFDIQEFPVAFAR